MPAVILSLAQLPMLAGCSTAPSLAVFGAGFPSWLFCMLIGIVVTVAVHLLSGRLGFGARLAPVALTYPLVASLAAMLAWLLLFPA